MCRNMADDEPKKKFYGIVARIKKKGGPDLRYLKGGWRTEAQKRGDKKKGPRKKG